MDPPAAEGRNLKAIYDAKRKSMLDELNAQFNEGKQQIMTSALINLWEINYYEQQLSMTQLIDLKSAIDTSIPPDAGRKRKRKLRQAATEAWFAENRMQTGSDHASLAGEQAGNIEDGNDLDPETTEDTSHSRKRKTGPANETKEAKIKVRKPTGPQEPGMQPGNGAKTIERNQSRAQGGNLEGKKLNPHKSKVFDQNSKKKEKDKTMPEGRWPKSPFPRTSRR